ncbi:membrane hypothetical protein [Desulfosarcina cetonica]|uniref:respiratory nitrate reductase subunit gamma n=1 Tax=Desulfosarcina cetonica TaxID=90730 RepID=UPI0006CF9F26|nr:respiratory nitrate reductase subunit gamma [Desulfosarcina cetonica]VTR70449.1 membrane hypothetical protein [Desulfosarcina cetonica]
MMDKFTFFWCLIIVAMTFFFIGVYKNFAVKIGFILWVNNRRHNGEGIGWRENLALLIPLPNRQVVMDEALLQRRIKNRSEFLWLRHLLIFSGFVVIFALDLFLTFAGHYAHHYFHYEYFLSGPGKGLLKFGMELSGAALFIGLSLGMIHRIVYAKAEKTYVELKLLLLLWLVTATGFLAEGIRLAGQPNDPLMLSSFIMRPIAQWLGTSFSWNWPVLADGVWCLHATFAAAFFAYIPFSKFIHILSAPLGRSITQNGEYAYQKRQRISEGLL